MELKDIDGAFSIAKNNCNDKNCKKLLTRAQAGYDQFESICNSGDIVAATKKLVEIMDILNNAENIFRSENDS